jgi:hypothetical protein
LTVNIDNEKTKNKKNKNKNKKPKIDFLDDTNINITSSKPVENEPLMKPSGESIEMVQISPKQQLPEVAFVTPKSLSSTTSSSTPSSVDSKPIITSPSTPKTAIKSPVPEDQSITPMKKFDDVFAELNES